jgi:hypothetical protein
MNPLEFKTLFSLILMIVLFVLAFTLENAVYKQVFASLSVLVIAYASSQLSGVCKESKE